MTTPSTSTKEAMSIWLALEHEAVWTYPVIGARVDALSVRATTAFEAHRNTRDDLLARLRGLGVEPPPAPLSYDIGSLTTAAEAEALARTLEAEISAACLTLVGETTDDGRTRALAGLRTAALAELTWGAEARAFPGLP